jgi:hypothetical protein
MKLEEELKKIEIGVLTRKQIEEFLLGNWEFYKEFFKNPELTEDFKLYVVNQNGLYIQLIKNPSEAVQLAAVNEKGWSIQFIIDPSEAVQLAAINQIRSAIYFINNPTERAKELARSKGVDV